jgi:hypothetical protein
MVFIENQPGRWVGPIGERRWSSIAVIPVRAERIERIRRLLESLRAAARARPAVAPVAAVFVLNSRRSEIEPQKLRNQEMRDFATQFSGSEIELIILDHASEIRAFDDKAGVGLARKIGCDFAAACIQSGQASDPWIRCTDADAEVPVDYFSPLPPGPSAYLFRFRHHFDAEDAAKAEAGLIYDAYLRYLRLGMAAAASTYAYHSIGSLIAVTAETYERVRGFPDYEAGEDFYFLNKVRKQGSIHWRAGEPVQLEGRASRRVPFGTGRSIIKILNDGRDSWPFYAPDSFPILGTAIRDLVAGHGKILPQNGPEFFAFAESRRMLAKFQSIGEQCKRPGQWAKRCLELFDAFEQMKFLHYLRDHGRASISWREALGQAPFLPQKIRQKSDELPALHALLVDQDESTPFV